MDLTPTINVMARTLVIIFLVIYTKYTYTMLTKPKARETIQKINTELEKLRDIPIKTLEEQKQFISMRYQPPGEIKITWKKTGMFFVNAVVFIAMIYLYSYIFVYFGINIKLWHAITFVLCFPWLFNIILKKFGVQRPDISVFLKW